MPGRNNSARNIVAIFLFVCLFGLLFQVFQGRYHIIHEKPLLGEIPDSSSCRFATSSFFDGSFQRCATAHWNSHMGFRNSLVRLYNTIQVFLFDISPVNTIVVGKDHYLFEQIYIDTYNGKDYIGPRKIREKLNRLVIIQDELKKKNVDFIFVLVPSKARFLEEKLPGQAVNHGNPANYPEYKSLLKYTPGLHVLDLNDLFSRLKNSSAFPLYPKGGTHWTNYSAVSIVMDTLLKYMEYIRGVHMPGLKSEEVYWSDSIHVPDNDIADLLNLIIHYPAGQLPYSTYHADTIGKDRPRVLAIADSYYWQIYDEAENTRIFRSNDFWAWNSKYLPESKYKNGIGESDSALFRDMTTHDFVILFVTEINLSNLLHFDEKMMMWLNPNDSQLQLLRKQRIGRIQFYKKLILADPLWLENVRKKALLRGISLEEMVQRDAEYMTDVENQKKK